MINGERIRQARELKGFTQGQLAERLGLTQGAIAHFENNLRQPTDETMEAIALQTGLPLTFFRKSSVADFPIGSLLYRKRATMSATTKARTYRYGQVMFELAQEMAKRIDGPPVRFPRVDVAPREAARMTRTALGLSPDTPIKNLILTLERAGVIVLELPIPMDGGDAFSVWAGGNLDRPVIIVSGDVPGDRLRLSVGHESGHLAMHQAPKDTPTVMEQEAFAYGAELLMPEAAMRQEIIPPITLTSLAELKPRWGVSIQALARRASDLEIISKRQYHYLFEQIGARGWRKQEPVNLDVPKERPRALRKMAELLYGPAIDHSKLAADMGLSTQIVRQIMDVHAGPDQLRSSVVQQATIRDNIRSITAKRS
jgi:Zn-dependent peptidase ImmA (M78 family)/transcriptional regulator with XRE-family HTH domain